MATRFRVYRRPIIANVEMVKNVLFTISFSLPSESQQGLYTVHTIQGILLIRMTQEEELLLDNGEMKLEQLLASLSRLQGNARGSNNFSRSAKEVRDDYNDYFNSFEGAVSWQTDVVTSTRNSFDRY